MASSQVAKGVPPDALAAQGLVRGEPLSASAGCADDFAQRIGVTSGIMHGPGQGSRGSGFFEVDPTSFAIPATAAQPTTFSVVAADTSGALHAH